MDARVPLWFGLGDSPREPTRFFGRIQPDGSLAWSESRDFFSWNELPEPQRHVPPPAPYEPARPGANDAARLNFNRRRRARGRVRGHNPEPASRDVLEKRVDLFVGEHQVQTRSEFEAWVQAEREEMARVRQSRR